ncbi:MAG: hypothetical protein LIP11_01645 [Clostridiales bacterium]|nr:hypothetical protein [Clostridiales bacterium]
MARVRRSKVEIIKEKIEVIDQKISGIQSKIDQANEEKAALQNELDEIEAMESKAAEEDALKTVLELMKEKNITASELWDLIETRDAE